MNSNFAFLHENFGRYVLLNNLVNQCDIRYFEHLKYRYVIEIFNTIPFTLKKYIDNKSSMNKYS